MRRLHRLLHNGEQVLTQLPQFYLAAQGCAELREYSGRVILSPVKAAINEKLKAVAQGTEQDSNHEC